jgi:hypothetical protein
MRRKYITFGCIGFFFGFFHITGRELALEGNLIWDKAYTLRTLFLSILTGAAAGLICCILPRWIKRLADRLQMGKKVDGQIRAQASLHLKPWQFFAISMILIFLCWFPVYLAYYPGICAYDVTMQTGQIVDHAYNDHHPIAHTLLLAGSMRLGTLLFGDANTGLGLLVFVQMLCLAAVMAWGITLLWKRAIHRGLLLCLQLFGMFYPFHMYMSVSVIKDVFFSVFFLLQMLALCEMIIRKKSSADGYDVLFGVSSVGMQLFRTNGRYALLVLAVLVAAAVVFGKGNRRFWGRLAVNCLASLLVGSLILSGLFRVTGAEQGDRREMLSMPIQQLARCMLYHGGVNVLSEDDDTMEEQDKALINDFLLDEGYREYRPEISDPVKNHTNTYVVRYRAGEFLRTYLHLLVQYPGDFINAALAVNAGYLYVGDESHATVNENGVDKGLGYVQTRWVEEELNPRGLYKDSKWESLHERLEKWADENAYLQNPVLRYLFVPGVFLWLYLLLAGCLITRRKYDRCMPLALVLGYYLTLFLGPTVQLRYIYPLMLTLPFAAVLLLSGSKGWQDAYTE